MSATLPRATEDTSCEDLEHAVFMHAGIRTADLTRRLGTISPAALTIAEMSAQCWRDEQDRWWPTRAARELGPCWQVPRNLEQGDLLGCEWVTVSRVVTRGDTVEIQIQDAQCPDTTVGCQFVSDDQVVVCRPHPLAASGPW